MAKVAREHFLCEQLEVLDREAYVVSSPGDDMRVLRVLSRKNAHLKNFVSLEQERGYGLAAFASVGLPLSRSFHSKDGKRNAKKY